MATVNPSVLTAFNEDVQNFYTIDPVGRNLYPNAIASISKADPAVVTVPVIGSVISTTGTIGTVTGSGTASAPWLATVTLMTKTTGLQTGQIITATAGTGTFAAGGEVSVGSIVGNQSIVLRKVGGTVPSAGTVTNISVPATGSLAPGLKDGDQIIITGVEGMTQLATAGTGGTNSYYVNVLNDTTFSLFTDPGLSNAVDSTGFTTAVANTGEYNTFTVIKYNSVGIFAQIQFPTVATNIGTDIDFDADTGVITLQPDITYLITVQEQPKNYAFNSNYIIVVDLTNDERLGVPSPIDGTYTFTVTPAAETQYGVYAVRPQEGQEWSPPSGVQYATLTVMAVSGYEQ